MLCITNVSAATWSGTGTTCSPVQCPPLEIVSRHVRVLGLNNSFAGTATFDCPFGYRLTGKQSIVCQVASMRTTISLIFIDVTYFLVPSTITHVSLTQG